MALHEPIATHQAGARELRSYSGDLSKWGRDIIRRYTTAIIFLVLGAIFLLVAAGFGVVAIFHFLALQYGLNIAFAIVGGFFVVVGLIGLATGIGLFKRSLPPVPRPTRQLQAFKRAAALDFILRRDQVQSVARRHTTRLGTMGAGVLAFGFTLACGYALLRSSRAADGNTNQVSGSQDKPAARF
jgi:hypothetical protein